MGSRCMLRYTHIRLTTMHCYECIEYDKEMLVYEIFDCINHIKLH